MSDEDIALCIVGLAATVAITYLRAFTQAGPAAYVTIVLAVIWTPFALRIAE